MKKIILLFLLFPLSVVYAQKLVKPTDSQIKWAEAEIGVIIHLDINIYAPDIYNPAKKETLPPLSVFNPQRLDTDQWIKSAKLLGAKYAVLVAKHGTGFCLWPTEAHGYHIGNVPFKDGKADIVADFVASCKRHDVKPGIYYNTNYNALFGAGYTKLTEEQRLRYNDVIFQQLYELWTNYGEWFEIWFDGGVMNDPELGIATEVIDAINEYQPNAILFQGPMGLKNLVRWVGNEEGRTPYPHWSTADTVTNSDGKIAIADLHGSPDGKLWIPGEADFPNRRNDAWEGGWLWRAGQENKVLSATELMDRYYTSVGHNSNMLVGMVIDTAGRFPDADSLEFDRFGSLHSQLFSVVMGEEKYVYGNKVEIEFKEENRINNIIIQEDVSYGERVRKYRIDYYHGGKWHKLLAGESIGHKRIHRIDERIYATKLRIVAEKYADLPIFKSFRVY